MLLVQKLVWSLKLLPSCHVASYYTFLSVREEGVEFPPPLFVTSEVHSGPGEPPPRVRDATASSKPARWLPCAPPLKLERRAGALASNTSVAAVVLWLMGPAAINELAGALCLTSDRGEEQLQPPGEPIMRPGSPARGLLSVSSWRRPWVITSPVCSSPLPASLQVQTLPDREKGF